MTKHTYTDEFEAFWKAYNRVQNCKKYKAFVAWKKATKLEEPEVITQGAIAYGKYLEGEWKKPGNNGYPAAAHASTWLNDRRWDDFTSEDRPAVNDKPIINTNHPRLADALFLLANKIGFPVYESWFSQCEFEIEWSPKGEFWQVTVSAPHKFGCDKINAEYADQLAECLLIKGVKDFRLSVIPSPVEDVTRETEVG